MMCFLSKTIELGNKACEHLLVDKYLGNWNYEDLSFDPHINNISNKLSKYCGLLYRIRYVFRRKICLITTIISEFQSFSMVLLYVCSNETNCKNIFFP